MSTAMEEPESRPMTPNISRIGAERPMMFPPPVAALDLVA